MSVTYEIHFIYIYRTTLYTSSIPCPDTGGCVNRETVDDWWLVAGGNLTYRYRCHPTAAAHKDTEV